jgi:mevalonate kinase
VHHAVSSWGGGGHPLRNASPASRFPSASAPARACLAGDHLDWAGGAAVVVPLDRAVVVEARPAAALSVHLDAQGGGQSWFAGEPGALAEVGAAAERLAGAWGITPGAELHARSEIPTGRGLGAGAALRVACVRALAALHGRTLAPDEEAALTTIARIGPSGTSLDTLAAAHGTAAFYRFDGSAHTVEALPAHLHLAVGLLRGPRDGDALREAVRRLHDGEVSFRDHGAVRRVASVRTALEQFASHALDARAALLRGQLGELGRAMDACQHDYENLLAPVVPGLPSAALNRAVRTLRDAGALGAKFSGAGSEGAVIGLYASAEVAAAGVRALDSLGMEAFPQTLALDP